MNDVYIVECQYGVVSSDMDLESLPFVIFLICCIFLGWGKVQELQMGGGVGGWVCLSKTRAPHVPFLQEFGLDHPDTALAEEFLAPWADGKCCGCCDWRCFFWFSLGAWRGVSRP